jgi:hypothetical protein
VLADLIETATDLHTADLAEKLGIPTDTEPAATGRAITARLSTTTRARPNTADPAIPAPHE